VKAGQTSRSYDANGNLTKQGADTFTYDSQNRLVAATVAGVTASYTYNHLDQRVTKTLNGHTRLLVYDLAGNLIEELDAATGDVLAEYVWLDGTPLGFVQSGQTYQVHVDHLGTPKALTDASGQVVWKADYNPFGKASITTQGPTFNLRFPGQYYDAETGFHYNWRRYYDPATGRYITSDPIGLAGGINTYAYALGNPYSYIDPTGEYAWVLIGGAIGAGLNIATQIQSGHEIDWSSVVASAVTGALGGGLGTVTKGLSWGKNIIANSIGSGLIGAGVTASKNRATGSCDDVWKSARYGLYFGGLGAIGGSSISNVFSRIGKGRYESLPLDVRLFLGSNAIHGLPKNRVRTIGSIIGDSFGVVMGNLPVETGGE
jgi:RHS repeat-associated protein